MNFRELLLPPAVSEFAQESDALFLFILGVCAFFFVLVIGLIVFFVIKYRARANGPKADIHLVHNTKLEIIWTIIPLVFLLIFFGWGFRIYMDAMIPPKDAIEIEVKGSQFAWQFTHLQSHVQEQKEVHVPLGKPVKFIMYSADTIHSLWPPALRIKQDLLPTKKTTLWFKPIKTGTYPIYCAEFCGTDHSRMSAKLIIVTPEEFESWLKPKVEELAKEEALKNTPAGLGKKVFDGVASCISCHAVEKNMPSPIAPSLYGIYNSKVELVDGSTVIADEKFLMESITSPNAKIAKGFQPSVMPLDFSTRLTKEQISYVVSYIKSLGASATESPTGKK